MQKNIRGGKKYSLTAAALLFVLAAAAVSCSNGQGAEAVYADEETLRSVSEARESGILWTRELESARLLRSIGRVAGIAEDVPLSPLAVSAAESAGGSVYPSVGSFGSLDTSLISAEMRAFLDGFCASVASWTADGSALEDGAAFTLALFKYDVENNWRLRFGAEFPVRGPETEEGADSTGTAAAQSDSGTPPQNAAQPAAAQSDSGAEEGADGETAAAQSDSARPAASSGRVFDSWLYGKPFIDGGSFQVPVRFFCEYGAMDALVCVTADSGFQVSLIQIQRWEKRDGK